MRFFQTEENFLLGELRVDNLVVVVIVVVTEMRSCDIR